MKAGRILLFACLFLWTGVSAWAIANPENRCSRVAAGAISNARYYDPELGRFIQADTEIPDLSNPQSYNRYAYCVNDPLRYNDPTGHYGVGDWWRDTQAGAGIISGWASSAGHGIENFFVGGQYPVNNERIMLSQEGIQQFTPLTANGKTLGNPATAVVAAGGGALVQAGMMLTPAVDEEAAGLAVKEGEKVVKALGEKGDTYLYQKVGANGEHLKFGITKNPATRYTKEELNGGRLKIIGQGSRKDMLQLERNLHETLPIGPEEGQKVYIQKQVEQGLKPPPYVQEKPAQ